MAANVSQGQREVKRDTGIRPELRDAGGRGRAPLLSIVLTRLEEIVCLDADFGSQDYSGSLGDEFVMFGERENPREVEGARGQTAA